MYEVSVAWQTFPKCCCRNENLQKKKKDHKDRSVFHYISQDIYLFIIHNNFSNLIHNSVLWATFVYFFKQTDFKI